MNRRHLLLLLTAASGLLGMPATSRADEAAELAASAGITRERAETDLAAQHESGDVVGRLRTALGASFGGVYFNLATGYYMVAMPPGADRAAAQEAMMGLPSRYPKVARTYAELEAAKAAADERYAAYEARQQAQTYIYPRGNVVKVALSASLSSASRTAAKSSATAGVSVVTVPASSLAASAVASCEQPYCMEGGHGIVRGGVGIHFGEIAHCSAGFIVSGGGRYYMLTAGHCDWYLALWSPPWNVYRPQYSDPSPCQMPGSAFFMDEAHGDMGLATVDGCEVSRAVEEWASPPVALPVERRVRSIFNCVKGVDCNRGIPADERSYPGLWSCHSGWATGTRCGEVRFTDATVTGAYPEGRLIPIPHVELVCATVNGGDSGGPVFTHDGGHAVATGIVVLGAEACSTYGQEIWWIEQTLGVRLP